MNDLINNYFPQVVEDLKQMKGDNNAIKMGTDMFAVFCLHHPDRVEQLVEKGILPKLIEFLVQRQEQSCNAYPFGSFSSKQMSPINHLLIPF